MSLTKFVKIGSVSNLSDARYCAGMMVDILGFDLDPQSADYVSPTLFEEITGWTSGVPFAGEFGAMSTDEIRTQIKNYKIDYVETTSVHTLQELSDLNVSLILKMTANQELAEIMNQASSAAAIMVIEPGDMTMQDLDSLVKQVENRPEKLLLALPNAIEDIIELDSIWSGVQLVGSPEERPGFKDYGWVMDILEKLEEID